LKISNLAEGEGPRSVKTKEYWSYISTNKLWQCTAGPYRQNHSHWWIPIVWWLRLYRALIHHRGRATDNIYTVPDGQRWRWYYDYSENRPSSILPLCLLLSSRYRNSLVFSFES